jgi:hypothetical protein
MALSQAEWWFDSIPVTILSVSDATSMLSDGGSNAMSSQLPTPTDAMPQSQSSRKRYGCKSLVS